MCTHVSTGHRIARLVGKNAGLVLSASEAGRPVGFANLHNWSLQRSLTYSHFLLNLTWDLETFDGEGREYKTY